MTSPSRRVEIHPVLGPRQAGTPIRFTFDGEEIEAQTGDVISVALLAHGRRALGVTVRNGRPRGMFCGIGHCFECQVSVDGVSGVRACLTPVTDGMRVTSSAQVEIDREH